MRSEMDKPGRVTRAAMMDGTRGHAAARRSLRARSGFSLIEVVTVVTIISILVSLSGGMASSQISFVRTRSSVETLARILQRAQALARAHGNARVRLGVCLFPERLAESGSLRGSVVAGWSCIPYITGPRETTGGLLDHLPDLPNPGLSLDAQPAAVRTALVCLAPGLELHGEYGRRGPIGAAVYLAFDHRGALDPSSSTLVPLRTEPNVSPSPFDDNYTFDCVDPSVGYMRVRVRGAVGVELSGMTDPGTNPPVRAGGGWF